MFLSCYRLSSSGPRSFFAHLYLGRRQCEVDCELSILVRLTDLWAFLLGEILKKGLFASVYPCRQY